MTFGEWLRQQRLSKGYSLRELARRANDVCRHSYISQLESNTGGKKRWEAQEGSVFYKLAQVAVVKKLKPNPSGINALLTCGDEYWKNLDQYPPLFFDAHIGPELTEEQYAEIDNAR